MRTNERNLGCQFWAKQAALKSIAPDGSSVNEYLTEQVARLYASVHRGTAGDRDFYRRLAEQKARVLELGCGFGRIAIEMAKSGTLVVGIDREPEFLKLAKTAAEVAEVTDLTQFWQLEFANLGKLESSSFNLVTLPHSTIYCELTKHAQLLLFQQAHRVLQEGGLLAFDAYFADDFHQQSEPDDMPDDEEHPVIEVTDEGRVLSVSERSSWDKPAQRIDSTFVYRDSAGVEVLSHTIPQRYLLSSEARMLLKDAGFREVNLASDYSGTLLPTEEAPAQEGSDEIQQLVVLAEK